MEKVPWNCWVSSLSSFALVRDDRELEIAQFSRKALKLNPFGLYKNKHLQNIPRNSSVKVKKDKNVLDEWTNGLLLNFVERPPLRIQKSNRKIPSPEGFHPLNKL